MDQKNDPFPVKWMEDSNLMDSNPGEVNNKPHLFEENYKIVDKSGKIYVGQQFTEEKKPLAQQAKESLEAGGKLAVGVATQVASVTSKVSSWGFNTLVPFFKKAGTSVVGNLQGLQDIYKKYKESKQQNQEQNEKNTESIDENWQILISNDTPEEEVQKIMEQFEEDSNQIKIIRTDNAYMLQQVEASDNDRILQFSNCSEGFQNFVERQQSRIHQNEFGMLESDLNHSSMRGALQIPQEEYDQIKRDQELAQNREFDYSFIMHGMPPVNSNSQENDQQQLQQQQQQDQQQQQQDGVYVYRMNNILQNNEPGKIFDQSQMGNFMQINIPQINPYAVNQNNQQQVQNNQQDQNNNPQMQDQQYQDPNYNHQYNNNYQQNNYNYPQENYNYPQNNQYNQQNNQNYSQNNNNQNYQQNNYNYPQQQQNNQHQYESERQLEEPMLN